MAWSELSALFLCQNLALCFLSTVGFPGGQRGQADRLWSRCDSTLESHCSRCGPGVSDLCIPWSLYRGYLPEPWKALPWGAWGTFCPGCEHILPHLLGLWWCMELDRLEFQFCLLPSLSLPPHLGNSGNNASSWNRMVVQQDGDGGKEERHRLHVAVRHTESLALGSGSCSLKNE